MKNKEIHRGGHGAKVISTKINISAYESLSRLAKSKGLTIYDLVQMVCDTLIRYMDDRTNLSPEIEQVMALFEHMAGWKDTFNFADPSVSPEVSEAIYFLAAPSKKGTRAVLVEKPFMGTWAQTLNVQQILERSVCHLNQELYKKLRVLGSTLQTNSILETLNFIIDMYQKEGDISSIRKEFEDADRSEYGKKPVSAPYVRHVHKDITLFDCEDAQ